MTTPPEGSGRAPADVERLLQDLTDSGRCPVCGSPLAGPRCGACGADLSGAAGVRLWRLSQQAAELLRSRRELLSSLRPAAAPGTPPSPAPVTPRAPRSPPAGGPSSGVPADTGPGVPGSSMDTGTPAAAPVIPPVIPPVIVPGPPAVPPYPPSSPSPYPPARAGGGVGLAVKTVLLALGALVFGSAALFFVAVAWTLLGLTGRTVVVGLLTVVLVIAASLLRNRLRATAEALAAVTVVLLFIDAWAVWRLGAFGADRFDDRTYAAGATAVLSVVHVLWARFARLRVASIVAAVLLPAAPVVAGVSVAGHTGRARDVGIGLLLAAVVSTVRRYVVHHLVIERLLLVVAAVAGIGSAALVSTDDAVHGRLLTVALLLALSAVATTAQSLVDGPRFWSPIAGAFGAAALVPLAFRAADGLHLDGRVTDWTLVLVPAVVALAVPVASVLGRRPAPVPRPRPFPFPFPSRRSRLAPAAAGPYVGVPIPPAPMPPPRARDAWSRPVTGVLAVLAGALGPAFSVGAVHVGQAAGAGFLPWQTTPWASVGRAGRIGSAATMSADEALATWFPVVLAAALVAGAAALGRRALPGPGRFATVLDGLSFLAAGACAVLVPLAPRLPIGGAVLGLVTVAVCAGLAAGALRDDVVDGGRLDGSPRRGAALAAVAVSSLAGVLAVLLAWASQALSIPTTALGVAALLLARGALRAPAARGVLAGVATASGLVVVGAAVMAGGGTAAGATAVTAVVGSLLGAAALSTVGRYVLALRPPTEVPLGRPWGRIDRWAVAAVAAVGLAVLVGVPADPGTSTARWVFALGGLLIALVLIAARPHPVLPRAGAPLAAQAAALVTGGLAGPLCVSTSAAAAVEITGLVLAAAGVIVVVVRGYAPTALALRLRVQPSYASLAYRCGLGAAAGAVNWTVGRAGGPAELWLLPIGTVLLAGGAVRLRRDPAIRSWQALAPGLVVVLAPSLWLSLTGAGTFRPVFVLVVAAVMAVVGAVARLQAPLVVGAAGLVVQVLVLVGPYLATASLVVPYWITGGVVGLILIALGATFESNVARLRSAERRVQSLR